MNLDDLSLYKRLDPQNMLAQIDELPGQLQNAWRLGSALPLPNWENIHQVIICGMGGSAIGGDLLTAYISPTCKAPVIVHRDYDLPFWAQGDTTLVIALSHSGNTEETLSSFDLALQRQCRTLAICTGGKLAEKAQSGGVPLWQFEHKGQPRAAVGYSFGLLLAAFARLGLIPNPNRELDQAVLALQEQQIRLRAEVPVVQNPAKRMAGQLMGRWVTVIGCGVLAPVAQRWKGQINELSKAWGQFDLLPEADHNTLAGLLHPQEHLPRLVALFLRASSYHPRNRLRLELTRKAFMLEGIGTDTIDAHGNSPLAQQWTALHFGDYMAYYLAIAYGVDPTPVNTIERFKEEMRQAG